MDPTTDIRALSSIDRILNPPPPPTTFPKFPDLPSEIRLIIWAKATEWEGSPPREFTVSAWSLRRKHIRRSRQIRSLPQLEASSPPWSEADLQSIDLPETVFEAMDLRGPPLPSCIRNVISTCHEARDEFLKKCIRFSGSAYWSDFLLFDDGALPNGGERREAKIVGKHEAHGKNRFLLDTENSLPSRLNLETDRLSFPASSFKSITFPFNLGGLDGILDRWLPTQVFEKLKYLSLDMEYVGGNRKEVEPVLLKFRKLQELVFFTVGIQNGFVYMPIFSSVECFRVANSIVEELAERHPEWNKPHVVVDYRIRYADDRQYENVLWRSYRY